MPSKFDIPLEGERREPVRRVWSEPLHDTRGGQRPDPITQLRDAAAGRGGEVRYSNTREILTRASRINLLTVLEDFFGIRAPDTGWFSWKGQCPFGFEHPDGGLSKGFRTYPATNSGYCFVMHGWMDAVRIMVIREECSPVRAARRLLEHYGMPITTDWRKRSSELIAERATRRDSLGDPTWAAHALQTSLERYPAYVTRQFDDEVATAMDHALRELDEMMRSVDTTDDDLRRWLRTSTDNVLARAGHEERP